MCPGVQVSIGVDNSLPRSLRFCSHLMGQQIFGHLFIHLSWKQISRPVEILRCIFFLVWQKNEVKKITDAFHDLVDGKRILREVKTG